MKSIITLVLVMFAAGFARDAAARLNVSIAPSTEPAQVGNTAKARIGVEGKANSSFTTTLTVAAGATLACEGSTLPPIDIQRPNNVSYPLPGYTEANVLAPASGEGQYEIGGFNTWAPGVAHLCNLQMKAAATEAAASLVGNGIFFTLNNSVGGATIEVRDIRQFNMIRIPVGPPGPSPCCGMICYY